MVIVPLRAEPVFAPTLKPTDPLPVPLAPDVTVIHDALLVAVHVQLLADAVTAMGVPAPAVAGTESLVGAVVYVELGGVGAGGVGAGGVGAGGVGAGGAGAGGAGAGGTGVGAAASCVSVCV